MTRSKGKNTAVAHTLLGSLLFLMILSVVLFRRPATGYSSQVNASFDLPAREERGQAALDIQEQDLDQLSYLPLVLKNCCGYCIPVQRRFGFNAVRNGAEEYEVSLLHAGWYQDFGFRANPPSLDGLEYAPTIRLCDPATQSSPFCDNDYVPSQTAIEAYAAAHPGSLYLIGNEPDASIQDCITPPRYAQLYHDLYDIIKGADPSARVAIGGVVQATPLRLQYLDEILQKYQDFYGQMIPVDVWNVHGFILQEKANDWGCQIPCGLSAQQGMLYGIDDHDNMTIFKQQIVAFRQWMKDRGERNKPLIVTEYGILFPDYWDYDQPRVEAFMLATFDYLTTASDPSIGYPADCGKLVQGWGWYSLDDDHYQEEWFDSWSHLFDPDTNQITDLGTAYGDYISSLH